MANAGWIYSHVRYVSVPGPANVDEDLILILVHFFSYRENPVWHSKKQRKVISIPSTMALSAESEQLLAPLRAAVKVMLFF